VKFPRGTPVAAGFSLVEVALSLAILAVGMVGVLALLPVGLESARQVHAEAVMVNLVRTSLANFATNGWKLNSYQQITPPQVATNTVFREEKFTVDGVPVVSANTDLTNQAYFRLEYTLMSATTNSARYHLRLRWPEKALETSTNSPILQSRSFVTEVLRGY